MLYPIIRLSVMLPLLYFNIVREINNMTEIQIIMSGRRERLNSGMQIGNAMRVLGLGEFLTVRFRKS